MAGAATMVVIWGNILSFIGNVVALAVEVLVFNAFFLVMKTEKSMALYSLVVGHCYILVYIRWHKIWIHTQNASRSRFNIFILCFFVPKSPGSEAIYRCNGIFCFIFL